VRPATQAAMSQSMEQVLKTPRTAMSARPITASSGRSVRYNAMYIHIFITLTKN